MNEIPIALPAARDGLGIADLPDDDMQPDIDAGRLTRGLEPWCSPFPGYHLCYPSRRQQSRPSAADQCPRDIVGVEPRPRPPYRRAPPTVAIPR